MTAETAQDFYRRHGPLSDPGRHADALQKLDGRPETLAAIVQGLLIHGDWLELYGLSDADFPNASRTTLPVAQRLDAILDINASLLTTPRTPTQRSVGTCRDDALMLCALLRACSVPARVRCGFATYFKPGHYEDHWVCEYWNASRKRWALADAQLDAPHRRLLGIRFDTNELPAGSFVSADQAWGLFNSESAPGHAFGHGEATGAWFLRVNLERDLRALQKQETSDWDGWRAASSDQRTLDAESTTRCTKIAAAVSIVDKDYPRFEKEAAALCEDERPFWR
jgi:hypothetical protein